MNRVPPVVFAASILFGVCSAALSRSEPPPAADAINLGLRGVYFVENQGQWSDETVHYGLKSRGLDVAFRESSFTMHLSREVSGDVPFAVDRGAWASRPYESELADRASRPFDPPIAPEASPKRERGMLALDDPDPLPHGRGSLREPVDYEHLTLTITFPGCNPVTPRGAQPQAAKFNYFVGGQGRGIASNVPSFAVVIYEGLYDGIDLLVCGNDDGVMKYEFHCSPGADYTQIRIHYDGIESLCVNTDGDLEIATSFGTLRDGAPIVWQEAKESTSRAREEAEFDVARAAPLADTRGSSGAMRTTLPARFDLIDRNTYTIALDATPDPTLPLVIDPEIEWMYYLGGSGQDVGNGIAVDSAGNALVTGWTWSTDFAGRNNSHHGGGEDAFALKVSPSGQLQWMTYLGGSSSDYGEGIAVDSAGNALVTGSTESTDFAGRNNSNYGLGDAFALKVSPSGQLQWMTYLGGSNSDYGYGIATDGAGNALVTGFTDSTDFAGRNNSYYGGVDAFALKVSPSGQLQWMTYLGGSRSDYPNGIAVDGAGNALVTGWTWSTDFAGRNNSHHGGLYDAFVLKVSPSGQLQWMTYLGGSGDDPGEGIAVDSADNALVTGSTLSTDFAGRNNSHHGGGLYDAFALKVSPSGQLMWMTYLGGSASDRGEGLAVDSAGNALVAGWTASTDFAGRNNSHHGGFNDAFALKVSPSGQLQWMTYLGGSNFDWGFGIAVDAAGNALVTGETLSTDFFGRNNSYYGGTRDAFLLKLRLAEGPRLSVDATCPSGGPIRIEWTGASPGGQIALIFARNTGSFTVPNNFPCAGTQLGLGSSQIQLAFQGGAGANGSRILNTTAGPGACGGYLQLLDLTTCGTSNVARVE